MKSASAPIQQQVIQQYCKQLRVPTIGCQFCRLAEAAASQQQSHLDYLEALLAAEMEEREQNTIQRRLKEAHLPKIKTLEEFNIVRSIRTLGDWKGTAASYKLSVSSLPSDATDVAALVQARGEGPIVGAAARSLH